MDTASSGALPSATARAPSEPPPLRRLLFVTRTFPSGFELSVNGVYQRMRLFLEAAIAISARVDILFFVEPAFMAKLESAAFARELKKHWGIEAHVHFAPRESHQRGWIAANVEPLWNVRAHADVFKTGGKRQAKAVDDLLDAGGETIDLVFAFQFEAALPVMSARGHAPRYALDLNDVEHIKYPRMLARPPHSVRKSLQYAYWPALFIGESAAIRRSATTFVCSQSAADRLAALAGQSSIRIAPNAVRWPRASTGRPASSDPLAALTLLFVGIYAYPPNLEAAEYLVGDILPIVRASLPAVRLVFVGSYIDRIAHLDTKSPHVVLKGFVDDMEVAYRDAAIACCPILAGGGTRTKIIEAAAHHVPVVATTLGAEGLEFDDETEILRRDDAASFAQACIDLIRDPYRAASIAEQAYQRARIYDRDVVIKQISSDLITAASRDR